MSFARIASVLCAFAGFLIPAVSTTVSAAPVFIQGYDLTKRGVYQRTPDFCAPAVTYLMAQYGETRSLDLLKDGATAVEEIAVLAVLLKVQGGAGVDDIVAGVKSMYGGYLIDGKGEKYPQAWSQLRDTWTWNDFKARIGANLPVMLGVEHAPGETIDHVVFAYGYEVLNAGAANEADWIYLFDPFSDASGNDTSKNPKKWQIDKSTLKILSAVDALDPTVQHLDADLHRYKDRSLLMMVTGGSAPEPGSLVLLGMAAAALGWTWRGRRRSAKSFVGGVD